MGQLTGYSKRIKLTIDNAKVDGDLSDFPVTIFFTSSQAEEIFAEFDADGDYMKCAFTTSDGVTQLYAEKELFDHSESKAIYHVKVTAVSSSAGTDIYYYYNNTASDNTTYIGAINTTAGATVWDANFKAVYHMVDATTSTILDSTSNNNDGTKKAANEPIEATGKVGQGQDFDGTDDTITVPDSADFVGGGNMTSELIFKTSTQDLQGRGLFSHGLDAAYNYIMYLTSNSGDFYFIPRTASGTTLCLDNQADNYYADSTFRYMVGTFDKALGSARVKLYRNGTSVDTKDGYNEDISTVGTGLYFADYSSAFFPGTIDEVRYSNSTRSAGWIKATYNSLWDTLLTYGAEERVGGALFFAANF